MIQPCKATGPCTDRVGRRPASARKRHSRWSLSPWCWVLWLSAACAPPHLNLALRSGPSTATETPRFALGSEAAPELSDGPVRFVVVGDPGLHGENRVAEAVSRRCGFHTPDPSQASCDFTVLLGDNLYPKGIRRRHQDRDTKRLEEITAPYARRPVYLILGNHDWGGARSKAATAQRQLEWIQATEQRFGGTHFWELEVGPLHLWALDTTYLVRRPAANHDPALHRWLSEIGSSPVPWKVALGHHPYLSNGRHGNAGSFRDGGLPVWPGRGFRLFFERFLAGQVDLYLSGHEHNLQLFADLGEPPRTAAAIVGSGAKCEGPRNRPFNPQRTGHAPGFEHYDHGFAIVEASQASLELTFFDADAEELWSARRRHDGIRWEYETQIDRTPRCRERR